MADGTTCECKGDPGTVYSDMRCGFLCAGCGCFVGTYGRIQKTSDDARRFPATASVISLVPKGGNPDVIDTLERMLARAKAGEISGLIIVAHTPSGVANDWGGRWAASELKWAVDVLAHQMIKASIEDGKDKTL